VKDKPAWRRWPRLFRRPPGVEVEEELNYHFEERVRGYMERGLSPEAARLAARARLGDLERVRNECASLLAAERRDEERRRLLTMSWLDVKLGMRMMAKYPGLSLVAVLGMAVATAIAAGYFSFFGAVLNPALPLAEGDRVVALLNRNIAEQSDPGVSVHDFGVWRSELKAVRDIGAFREESRNLITADGRTELVRVAVMTASGFRLTRTPPMLGRTLLEEDERASAAPVVVIGYEEWQRRFDAASDIIGRTVRLGQTVHTVIGVMPAGFAFPVNHAYWVGLRLNNFQFPPGAGPSLQVFGRIADDFTLTQARAELETIGRRMSAAYPETHEQIRPQILAYSHGFMGIESPEMALAMRALQLMVSLLLAIVAVNVAILVYARTATRTGEIAVRSALGASRSRVVMQLFVEALVLSGAAAVIGLTIAGIGLGKLEDFWTGDAANRMPFWLDFGLSRSVIVYVALLAIFAATVVGVLPALKATGRRLQLGLQQFSSRGAAMQLGRTWTALIIVQVAIAVAALPAALNTAEQALRLGTRDPAAAAHRLVKATLTIRAEGTDARRNSAANELADEAYFANRMTELIRRLGEMPEVSTVSFGERFPGHERWESFEAEVRGSDSRNEAAPQGRSFGARPNLVAINFLNVFDAALLAGRGFTSSDARAGASAVIVTEALADRIGGAANVVGRRIRYAGTDDTEPGPWLEIVGVVRNFADDFKTPNTLDDIAPRVFHAAAPGQANPAAIVVRLRADTPASFEPRLRAMAALVDPSLTLERLESVVAAWEHDQQAMWSMGVGIAAVMFSVLLLSAAGIYAMMSFTVAKRRREIGIRAALGADAWRILPNIFARTSAKLGAGVLAGMIAAVAVQVAMGGPKEVVNSRSAILLALVAALMMTTGLLAALGPARRALSVQPTEALRSE
jgi:putative ABC transport system permease protein